MLNIELAGLLAASLVICIGTLLTYFGQVGPIADDAARVAKGEIVNLNRVQKAGDLVAALKPALPESADRAFAARELFQFISTRRAQGETLVNVGALGRATVDPARVRSTQGLQLLRERAPVVTGRFPFSPLRRSPTSNRWSSFATLDSSATGCCSPPCSCWPASISSTVSAGGGASKATACCCRPSIC